jgi:hypothetical protein
MENGPKLSFFFLIQKVTLLLILGLFFFVFKIRRNDKKKHIAFFCMLFLTCGASFRWFEIFIERMFPVNKIFFEMLDQIFNIDNHFWCPELFKQERFCF